MSSGTVAGDLNGDGDLNMLDINPFALALIDPAAYAAAYPNGNINLADMDHDGLRNGLDISVFVSALLGPPPPCKFGRKYAHVTKSANATGCIACIDTRATTLCGEPTETKPAGSLAFVGVTLFSGITPQKWAQTGYARYRSRTPPHNTTVSFLRYAETKAGPQQIDYHWENGPAPDPGSHKYNCHLISSLLGTWRFEYDDELWHQFTRPGWVNQRGSHYQYEAEIWNKQDQMVGTDDDRCNFSGCQLAVSWGAFQDTNITTSDLQTSDAAEWGIERLSATAIVVWDKNP